MELPGKIAVHFLLDCLLFILLWLLLMRGRRRLRKWPLLCQYRYAHRGLHDLNAGIPENSLAAFRRAAQLGYGAELDVHLTKDGRLAVVHDSDLQRVCGRAGIVEELTREELDAYRLFGTSEPIPLLEDVLPHFAGRQSLIIEIKTRRNASILVDALCTALDGYAGDFLVESFDPWALYLLRLRRPDFLRGQLSKNFLRDRSIHPIGGFFLTNLLLNFLSKPDFIAYRYEDRHALSFRLCKKFYGVREFSWTITTPEAQAAAESDGATVIFEDYLPT